MSYLAASLTWAKENKNAVDFRNRQKNDVAKKLVKLQRFKIIELLKRIINRQKGHYKKSWNYNAHFKTCKIVETSEPPKMTQQKLVKLQRFKICKVVERVNLQNYETDIAKTRETTMHSNLSKRVNDQKWHCKNSWNYNVS